MSSLHKATNGFVKIRPTALLALWGLLGCSDVARDPESETLGEASEALVSAAYDLSLTCEYITHSDVIPGLAAWGGSSQASVAGRLDAHGVPTGGLIPLGKPTPPMPLPSIGDLTGLRLVELPSGGAAVVVSYAYVAPFPPGGRYFSIWFRTIAADNTLSAWELIVSEHDPLVMTHATILDVGFDGTQGFVALTHGWQWGTDEAKTYADLEVYALPSNTSVLYRPYSGGSGTGSLSGLYMGMGCTIGSCIALYSGCNAVLNPTMCWTESRILGGATNPLAAGRAKTIEIVPVPSGWVALFGGTSLFAWSFNTAGVPSTPAPVPVLTPAGGVIDGDAVREGSAIRVVWRDASNHLVHALLDANGAVVEGPTTESVPGPYANSLSTLPGPTSLYFNGPRLTGRYLGAQLEPPPHVCGTLGFPCAYDVQCESGYCSDGVCCDVQCGGSLPSDCQACSVAAGATVDGECGVAIGTTCRQANGPCDVAEVCDGSAITCPTQALAPAGTSCRVSAGECDVAEACSGAGDACPGDVGLANGTPCGFGGQCQSRVCVGSLAPIGSPCGVDAACHSGHCVDSVCCDTACGGNSPIDCASCSVATGATANGTCTSLDGVNCNDESGCSLNDMCQSGTCSGTSSVVCSALDECHDAGVCDPTTSQCNHPEKADGTSCSIGTCQAGVCAASGTNSGGASSSIGGGLAGGSGPSTAGSGASGSGAGDAGNGEDARDGGCSTSASVKGSRDLGWLAVVGVGILIARRRRA